jgi:plasmid stability protein
MTTLTIRRLELTVKERLRLRAARQGHSMEEEARRILKDALATPDEHPSNAYEAIRRYFAPFGGVDFDLPERQPGREPPTFD